MAPCLVTLKPNIHFEDANFEGYKLSLSPVPSIKQPSTVLHYSAPSHMYSLAHAKLFSLHNHLYWDNWTESGVYFVNHQSQIQKIVLLKDKFSFKDSEIVFEIPQSASADRHNVSLKFCSKNIAIISDGAGSLYLLQTGIRTRENCKWKLLFECRPIESGIPFVIADARLEDENNGEKIHCLLHRIEHLDDKFQTILEWIVLNKDSNVWNLNNTKKLHGKGCLHYSSLEPGCSGVYLASDHTFSFVLSPQEVIDSEMETEESDENKPKKLIYTWLQTGEDITLTLQLGSNFDRFKLNIKHTINSISIKYDDKPVLQGELYSHIDEDLTTWNIGRNGQLDILLTKFAIGLMWKNFLKGGDPEGEQIMNPTLVQEIHNRLAHLCSESEAQAEGTLPGFSNQQLEECDAVSEENTSLVRIDGNTHKTTHMIPLSIHQVVVTVHLGCEESLAVGLRHDVDTCIWQPKKAIGDIWPVKHEATLPAFGYVQSSKQNKKFNACSFDFNYSVVCEANRHIFVYKRESSRSQGCQLRRRTGVGENEKIKIGEQLVLSVEKDGEIFGIVATNEILYVLTETSLIAFQMAETTI